MYRHAKPLPKRGFSPTGEAGTISDGPTAAQRQAAEQYRARIEAERERFLRLRSTQTIAAPA